MGLRCAASHSFDKCKYEIIGSIDYSPGPLNQAMGRVDRVTSRPGVTIYCILNEGTIEQVMFDLVATKDDAATICLRGQRIPREFKPVDMAEIMATVIEASNLRNAASESDCESEWPQLCMEIRKAALIPINLTRC
jgi:hypothetical protein